jgi:hypothetical protein
MKRLFRIFDLTKNEQRVILFVVLVLVAIAFIQYERRLYRPRVHAPSVPEEKTSPSPGRGDAE